MTVTVETLAEMLSAIEYRGDGEVPVENAASFDKAGPGEVTFVKDAPKLKSLGTSLASAVILPKHLVDSLPEQNLPMAIIVVEDALAAFVQVLEHFSPRRSLSQVGLSPAAVIDSTVTIGDNANIFPAAQICADVVIGNNCTILPGVYIGPGCRLGDDVTLHPNVVLYDSVILGHRVTIHSSSVIGADGFGYQLVEGRHQRIPHFGTVRIEDDVEIGACTTIDRALVGETLIGAGTKIDNLVMIGHNCEIGRHNLFVSQVGLAGSVTTGEYVVCAGQVGILDHVHLGDAAVFGGRAGVHKDMPGGQTYLGSPAEPIADEIRMLMVQRKLPELRRKIIQLEQQMKTLTDRIDSYPPEGDSSNFAA
ncbi:MAG: UDP-3-O-(3-hydroxymyristoyl)glucosamine N-acyltransferase [Planctomycetes bacterium]|nr:UDP-3-O-(3-hydroxymyristoyl)glucosamine N-acyltransferase [Planctomycetota bacterium]